MMTDGKTQKKKSILTNKCFYQTTAQIMHDFETKGYANSADETIRAISAYHNIIKKKSKNNFNEDYNLAFQRIDTAIKTVAGKVFYDKDKQSLDLAYNSFENFDHVGAIVARRQTKKNLPSE